MGESSETPGTITPAAFHAQPGVADWRVTSTGPQAAWRSASLRSAASLVDDILAAAESSEILPDIDLRPEAVVVRVPSRDLDGIPARTPAFAEAVSAAAIARGLVADPSLVQTVGIYVAQHSSVDARPFFLAALGYEPVGDTDAADPLRTGPPLAFNPITGDARGRGRTHFDVFVPADQARARVDAALAAGGRLADDSYAPQWWSLASPDNHGVDIASWTDTFD